MALFQQSSSSENVDEPKQSDLVLLGAVASVIFSGYEFYVNDNPERAVFIGQWPPTILAFATYMRNRMRNN